MTPTEPQSALHRHVREFIDSCGWMAEFAPEVPDLPVKRWGTLGWARFADELLGENARLEAAGERDRQQIARLIGPLKEIAVEVKLADDLNLETQIAALWQVVRRHSKIAADALAMGDNPRVAPTSQNYLDTGTERQASATSPDVSLPPAVLAGEEDART